MITLFKLQFELPEKKIFLSREELQHLVRYLMCCETEAFTGIYNFHRLYPEREDLLKFSLLTFLKKATQKFYGCTAEKIKLSVNQGEEIALRSAFQRVQPDSFILALQEFIKRQLQSSFKAAKVKRKSNRLSYKRRSA